MVPKLLGRHVRVAATFARFARLARYFALFSDAARSLVEGIRLNRAANVHKAMKWISAERFDEINATLLMT